MTTIETEHFLTALNNLLDEAFSNVRGYFLDHNTSLYETLADITAAEASIPVGGKCATLAAQVKHIAFFLDYVEGSLRQGEYLNVDWGEIWRTVSAVTPAEWAAIQTELRAAHQRILKLIADTPAWTGAGDIAGALAVLAHTAYHLGEIRQALCTLRA